MKGEGDRFSDEDADFGIQIGVAKLVKYDESQRVQQSRPTSAGMATRIEIRTVPDDLQRNVDRAHLLR